MGRYFFPTKNGFDFEWRQPVSREQLPRLDEVRSGLLLAKAVSAPMPETLREFFNRRRIAFATAAIRSTRSVAVTGLMELMTDDRTEAS